VSSSLYFYSEDHPGFKFEDGYALLSLYCALGHHEWALPVTINCYRCSNHLYYIRIKKQMILNQN